MKKFTHSGNIIMVGFGIMVLFMSWLVYQCTQNPSVMVSNAYYEDELKYQDVIDASANTVEFKDSIFLDRSNGQITIRIPAALNKQLKSASIVIYNKSDDKKDRSQALEINDEGYYPISTQDWGIGNYMLKLSMQSETKNYYKEFSY